MGLSRITWEKLSPFESHDYVGNAYNSLHGREPNSQRIREITACFAQGREYFLSASSASPAVKPVLTYYGASALAKGFILLRTGMREESLKPSHGLCAVGWQQTLVGEIGQVLDICVKATAGTFTEFVDAGGNAQATAWWQGNPLSAGHYSTTYPRPKFLDGDMSITLDDLLSRDLRTASLYQRTTGRRQRTHFAEVVRQADKVIVNVVPNLPMKNVRTHLG